MSCSNLRVSLKFLRELQWTASPTSSPTSQPSSQASSQPSRQLSSQPSSSPAPSNGPVCTSAFDYLGATFNESAFYEVGDVVTAGDGNTGSQVNYVCIDDSLCDQRAGELETGYVGDRLAWDLLGQCSLAPCTSSFQQGETYAVGDVVSVYTVAGEMRHYECVADSCGDYSYELEIDWYFTGTRSYWKPLGQCAVS